MDLRWRQRIASAGWLLISAAVLIPSVWVLVQAVTAASGEALALWAGWANILALPVGAIGTAIVVIDRARQRARADPPVALATEPPPVASPAAPPWMAQPVDSGSIPRPDLMGMLLEYLVADDDETVGITAVHGAGGFGKTTLANQAAMLPVLRERFPGGLLRATVGKTATGPALAQIVNDLIEQLTGTRPSLATADQAGYRLGVELDERPPILLVLDDVWTPEQLRPFLSGGARCKRLVTTRVPKLLPGTAHLVEVDEMSRDEAATLLTRGVAGVPRSDTTMLLELTGRWPLLVALVNGVLRWRTAHREEIGSAIATVVRQLSVDGPSILDITALAQRERAVDLTVRAGLELLPGPWQQRFVELGVFPDGVAVPDPVTDLLWGRTGAIGPAEAEALRGGMADLSLVQRRPGGVLLHDVLRSYLRGRLTPPRLVEVNADLVEAARRLIDAPAADGEAFPWWRLPDTQYYLWRYLCHHLADGHLDGELAATATSLDFVAAKTLRLGVAAIESDLARVPGDLSGVLRSRLSTSAHLLAPVTPSASFRDVLVSRLTGIPLLIDAVAAYAAQPPQRDRIMIKWPLPDLGPLSLVRVVVGGLGWLESCAVAPDGRWVVAGSHTGAIGMWERTTGTALAVLTGHTGQVATVAVSPDSAWIVSGGEDGTVRVWDAARRRLVHTLARHEGGVTDCAVSPDATRVASVGADETVRVTEIVTRRQLLSSPTTGEALACCAFLDDDVVLTASQYGQVVSHHVPTGTSTPVLTDPGAVVNAMAVAADASWVALTGIDDEIRIHDLAGREEPRLLVGHDEFVTSLIADGDRILSGSADGTLRVWDVRSASMLSFVQAHTSWVNDCAVSTGASQLVSVGTDGMLRTWDMTLLRQEKVDGHVDWVNALDVTHDGRSVASGGNDHTVRFWTADDGHPTGLWHGPTAIWSCGFDGSGDELGVIAVRGPYLLRRGPSGWSADELGEDERGASLRHSVLASRGQLAALAGRNGDVLIRSTRAPYADVARCRIDGGVNTIRFLADREQVVFGDTDGNLHSWCFRSSSPIKVLLDGGPVSTLAPFGGDTRLACLTSTRLHVLDIASLTVVATTPLQNAGVNDASVATDDRWLATASDDGELRVFALDAAGMAALAATMRVDGALFACRWRPGSHDLYAAGRRGVYAFTFIPASP